MVNVTRIGRGREIAYWASTLAVAFENAAGGMWLLTQAKYLRMSLTHLGYPNYFQYILGPWQLACAATVLAPRSPRVKEWAYAGAFFNYSSAFVSHLFSGDRPDIGSAVMAVFTVISWASRPADRRLPCSAQDDSASASEWFKAAIILALLLILSLFWSPKAA